MSNVQNLNVQVTPGLVEFPPSSHPGIGPCDPADWGMIPPGAVPGHPTAVQIWCEGTSEPTKYPSMLWSPQNLLPIPAGHSRVNLDFDWTPSSATLKTNCAEFDTMFAFDGLVFPFGFHIVFADGGHCYVCDPTGAVWLDAGFSLEPAPDVTHHLTFQMELDEAAKTLTWLAIIFDGKTYEVKAPNNTIAANEWPTWAGANGYKPQFQKDNLPSGPFSSDDIDNVNYTWMP